MKFTAQTTTTKPIDAPITTRWGARPPAVSTYTESGQPFFAHCELLDAVEARRKADSRACRHANRALSRNRHFRLDDVFVPITAAGGHIAGQNKIRQRGNRYVVRAPDPRFQHPAAPNWNGLRLAKIVNLLRHRVTADAPHLDVDNFAGPQRDGRLRILQCVDAFVQ